MYVYLTIKHRKNGVTQFGYLSRKGISYNFPYLLVDEPEFADEFSNDVDAVNAANKAVKELNFGHYESASVEFRTA